MNDSKNDSKNENKPVIPSDGYLFRVLIIDDDVNSSMIVSSFFPAETCKIDFAFDGISGVIQLSKCPYDLVILDWHMPFMGGDKVLERIEKLAHKGYYDSHNKNTQVIVYSAESPSAIHVPQITQFEYLGILPKMTPVVNRYQTIREIVKKTLEKREAA